MAVETEDSEVGELVIAWILIDVVDLNRLFFLTNAASAIRAEKHLGRHRGRDSCSPSRQAGDPMPFDPGRITTFHTGSLARSGSGAGALPPSVAQIAEMLLLLRGQRPRQLQRQARRHRARALQARLNSTPYV
jgi:hypothetical protein